jgi:hypothetical protein
MISVCQDYRASCALWGGMPGDTLVFATALVTKRIKSEYALITDVGGKFQLYG